MDIKLLVIIQKYFKIPSPLKHKIWLNKHTPIYGRVKNATLSYYVKAYIKG